jgi:hypothetical protein
VQQLEQTIKEQDESNEKLRVAAQLHREEAEIMQQIIRVRDKEVAELKRQLTQRAFEKDCLKGDVEELQSKVTDANCRVRLSPAKPWAHTATRVCRPWCVCGVGTVAV